MLTDPVFYAVAIPAICLTGISKGGFLSGAGGLSVPMMALVISPIQAAAIMLPILLAMDVVGVWAFRRHFDARYLWICVPGAIVGIVIGWLTAAYVQESHVRLLVGLMGAAFTIDYWLGLRPVRTAPGLQPVKGGLLAIVSGFTSFVSHNGGPPWQIYILPQRLENLTYAGTTAMYFAAVNALKLPPYMALGQFDQSSMLVSAVLLPLAPLSMYAGIWLVRRVPQQPFYRLAYLSLFAISLKLVWDGGRAVLGI